MNKHFGQALLLGANALVFGLTNTHAAANEAELEEVVVTGSRVVTNGNDSPTPVTVVSVEEMQAVRPGTVADQLNDMPQFSSSQGQQSGIGNGSANAGNANGSGNVLNLRNFGVTRNLVLFDGHRVSPNSGNGTVSVDMIPQLLLKRVDVVTGGASAVYGADAVTGVVNFISDTGFTGLKFNGQYGTSQENDGDTYALGVAGGADLFGGRGHIMGSYEYRGDEGIDARSEREWGRNRWLMAQVASPAGYSAARMLVANGTRPNASFAGLIGNSGPANPLANYYFLNSGAVALRDTGVPISGIAGPNQASGGSGSYFDQSLKAELNSHQLFARLDYDFTDSVQGWVKVSATDTYNAGYAISSPLAQASDNNNNHRVFVSNAFLTPAVRNLFTANGTNAVTAFTINKVHSGPGMQQYRQLTEVDGRNINIDTGLSGSFGEGWKWELAFIHGDNKMDVAVNNAMNTRKLGAALDAVVNPANGQIVCNVTLTNPTLYPGCVPYNVFGPSITSQEAGYIFDTLNNTTTIKMNDVEAFVAGSPFDNWAGPVNMAFSAQARKLSYEVETDVEPAGVNTPLDCTGLRLVTCNPGQSQKYFQGFTYARPEVSLNVKEAALEFDMPLLADVAAAKDLSLNGAFRFTDYSTSGSVNSWKAGLDWKITDELTFRGTRSRDIRAPTMHELYQPGVVGSYSGADFWTGQNLSTPPNTPAATLAAGNSRLTPELADTVTAGFVYRPDWAPSFSVALDGYYIKVKDAIVTYDGAAETVMLTCGNSGGTSNLCALIQRPINATDRTAANNVRRTFASPVNIATQWTKGVDLELNYAGSMFDKEYNLRLLTSYQPRNVNVDTVGGITTENAGAITGNPKWRATLVASMSLTDNLKVSVLERWRDGMKWYPDRSNGRDIVVNSSGLASVAYTNLNVAYTLEKFGGKTELYFNIQNLFDKDPPVYASPGAPFAGLNGTYPGDDGVGRYFTLGFRHRM